MLYLPGTIIHKELSKFVDDAILNFVSKNQYLSMSFNTHTHTQRETERQRDRERERERERYQPVPFKPQCSKINGKLSNLSVKHSMEPYNKYDNEKMYKTITDNSLL